jgi:hypothetical protein
MVTQGRVDTRAYVAETAGMAMDLLMEFNSFAEASGKLDYNYRTCYTGNTNDANRQTRS